MCCEIMRSDPCGPPYHSDWSLHNKPVRMKQNCSRKGETPLLPPLKKEKNGKLKHHILPFSGSADHIRVHSSLIPAHFSIFRCHSGSFRYIPVPFLSIPFHSGVILPRSGIFRLIPVYSVPFHSVPVLNSNALCCTHWKNTFTRLEEKF